MNNVLHLFPEPPAVVAPSRFDEIWKLWPNRAKKVVAKAKYDAILRGGFKTRTLDKDSGTYVEIELEGDHDRIAAGIAAYLKSQRASGSGAFGYIDGGKWIPHLSTFLNQGRWEDWL